MIDIQMRDGIREENVFDEKSESEQHILGKGPQVSGKHSHGSTRELPKPLYQLKSYSSTFAIVYNVVK